MGSTPAARAPPMGDSDGLPVPVISQYAPSHFGDWWRKGGDDHDKWCDCHLIRGLIIDDHQKEFPRSPDDHTAFILSSGIF